MSNGRRVDRGRGRRRLADIPWRGARLGRRTADASKYWHRATADQLRADARQERQTAVNKKAERNAPLKLGSDKSVRSDCSSRLSGLEVERWLPGALHTALAVLVPSWLGCTAVHGSSAVHHSCRLRRAAGPRGSEPKRDRGRFWSIGVDVF